MLSSLSERPINAICPCSSWWPSQAPECRPPVNTLFHSEGNAQKSVARLSRYRRNPQWLLSDRFVCGIGCVSLLALLATGCATSGREKVVEHPIPRLYGAEDPQFSRTMGTLLGTGILDGNRVDVLLNGDEIFPAMLQAIRSAKTTITFETFIYWSGSIGSEFTNALAERARAGVKVHVLLDWIGSNKMDASQLALMEQAGVQVRKYHKPHWYQLGRLNNRTHRKLLVVDGETGFTGGVGIADQWTGHAQDPEHWRDSHYRVQGPVVAQMQAVFMDNWIKVSGDVLHGPEYFPPLQPVGAGKAHVFSSSPSGEAKACD